MRKLLISLGVSIIVSACSSGDSGNGSNSGAVRGLNLPVVINVAPADVGNGANTAQAASVNSGRITAANATDAGTDYSTDQLQYYSDNNSLLDLEMANGLLCLLDKLRVTDMVNQGAYIAKLRVDACSQDTNNADQSNASTVYDELTVVSERADNQSPHFVKIWFDFNVPYYNSQQPGAITSKILVEVIIRESVSDHNPFGVFDFNYNLIVDASQYGGQVGTETIYVIANFRAYVSEENKPRFDFTYAGGNHVNPNITEDTYLVSSLIELDDPVGHAGRAKSRAVFENPDGSNYESELGGDFNTGYLKVFETDNIPITAQRCLSRTESFNDVFEYNLYHAADGVFRNRPVQAGERVEIRTSIYFTYNGLYGGIGQWGYWLQDGASLPDQATVIERETGEPYTIHISPGTMRRTDDRSGTTQYQTVRTMDSELLNQPNGEMTLYCYSSCPRGGLTQDMVNSAASIDDLYYADVVTGQPPHSYTLAIADHKVLLRDNGNGNALVDFSQLDLSAFDRTYLYAGLMYPETREVNPNSEVYYSWSSGSDSFWQLATLTDSNGQTVGFDDYLTFAYVHDAANDRYNNDPVSNPYHGQEMSLYYYRAGGLYGFPSGVNGSGSNAVSLRDGVELTNDEGHFLVKAIGILTRSVEKDISECGALNAEAVLTDPGLHYIGVEDLSTISFTSADKPKVTEAPRVIDGEIQ